MAEFSLGTYLSTDQRAVLKSRADVANQVVESFNSHPTLGALRQDTATTPVTFQANWMDGALGTYDPSNGSVEVATGINRYDRPADDVLTTLVHELTHAAQYMKSARPSYEAANTRPSAVARSVGYSNEEVESLWKDLNEAYVTYGGLEPQAHLVPAHYLGTSGSKQEVKEFVSKHPEFTKRFAEVSVNPNRPVQEHTKGYAEMNIAEKALFDLFGYAGNIDPAAPLAAARNLRLGKE